MVLGGRLPGRVGRRRILWNERPRRTYNACAGAFVALEDREERAGTLAAMPRPQDREPRRRRARDRRSRRDTPHSTDGSRQRRRRSRGGDVRDEIVRLGDRKSTRLNSSHQIISYAVFCLKKKTRDELDLVTPNNPMAFRNGPD